MARAVADGHDGEDDQRADLDDVDRHIDAGRAVHAAEGDVPHAEREHDAEQPHEQRAVVSAAEGVRPELARQIAAQNRRHAHHTSGIDPVIKVARPAGEELGDARELVGLGLGEKRLLGVQVRGAGARKELRQLGVADGRREAQQERPENAKPHGTARHGRAVERLHLERQPQECSRRDQRHRVHREAGEAQCCFGGGGFVSTARFCICGRHGSHKTA